MRSFKEGARSFANLGTAATTGKTAAIDKQVHEMQEGKAGGPLQGDALMTEVFVSRASGNDWGTAIMKAAKIGKDSTLARAGDRLGDETYRFINKDLPEAAEFAKKTSPGRGTTSSRSTRARRHRGWQGR